MRLPSEPRRVPEVRSLPEQYDVTGLSLPNAFHGVHRIPVNGDYVVKVLLGGVRPANSESITLALWVDDRQVQTSEFDLERSATFADDCRRGKGARPRQLCGPRERRSRR